jgi:SAM-dependent methyltransferase
VGRALTEEGPRGWAAPLHAHVLDAAAVGAGTRLLDLGCGPGLLARAAADRGAHVVGVDADRSAIALAAAAVPEAIFRVGDVHELSEPDGSVDVVTAVQLLAHVANPLKVLRAAARVLARPGGVVVATVWGRERECDMRGFGEALAGWLPARRPPAGPPPLTEPDRLRKLAGLAGLAVVALDEVRCPFDYPDADALLEPLLASGIGRQALGRAGPAAVRRAVLDRFAARRTPRGGYRLENLFRVLVART